MPKTKAEWRELDERLAREVMGLTSQAGLVRYGRTDLWWAQNGSRFGEGCWIADWQPHKYVTQAFLIVNKLLERDWSYIMERHPGRPLNFWFVRTGQPTCAGIADEEAQAICLAAEQWMDRRGDEP